jgi:hypothetical protein
MSQGSVASRYPSQEEFVRTVYEAARNIGLPDAQARVAAAQAAQETGYGQHVEGNNYFGIKAGDSWDGERQDVRTWEEINGRRVDITDSFRVYDNPEDSLRDWAEMVSRNFPDVMSASTFEEAAQGLNNGRYGSYATDSGYVSNLGWIERNIMADIEPSEPQFGPPAPPQSQFAGVSSPTARPTESFLNALAPQNAPAQDAITGALSPAPQNPFGVDYQREPEEFQGPTGSLVDLIDPGFQTEGKPRDALGFAPDQPSDPEGNYDRLSPEMQGLITNAYSRMPEDLRDKVLITSTYRPDRFENHLGDAVDIRVHNLTREERAVVAGSFADAGAVGLGVYGPEYTGGAHIHVDLTGKYGAVHRYGIQNDPLLNAVYSQMRRDPNEREALRSLNTMGVVTQPNPTARPDDLPRGQLPAAEIGGIDDLPAAPTPGSFLFEGLPTPATQLADLDYGPQRRGGVTGVGSPVPVPELDYGPSTRGGVTGAGSPVPVPELNYGPQTRGGVTGAGSPVPLPEFNYGPQRRGGVTGAGSPVPVEDFDYGPPRRGGVNGSRVADTASPRRSGL